MTEQRYPYRPDYAVPPGWVLDDHISARNISQEELAESCSIPLKLVRGIIAGEAPIDRETAAQLEEVLGVNASIWLEVDGEYRSFRRT